MTIKNERELKSIIKKILVEGPDDNRFTGFHTTIGKKLGGEFLDQAMDFLPGVSTAKKSFELGGELKQGRNQSSLNQVLSGTNVINFVRACEEFVSEFRDPSKSGDLINELSSMPKEEIEEHVRQIFNQKCQAAYVDYHLETLKTSQLPPGQFKQLYLPNRNK